MMLVMMLAKPTTMMIAIFKQGRGEYFICPGVWHRRCSGEIFSSKLPPFSHRYSILTSDKAI